jgi:ATP-dependent helicase/nuclease subunit A
MAGVVNMIRERKGAQRRAANPRESVWVDASAGTGKTSVLVDRVLRLLLDGAAPERILCITFTRAAAAEMSSRIIERLAEWATASDAELGRILLELTGERPGWKLEESARQLFARIVDAPAGFRIQTIHAFCQSVLRRFPLEAGVAPHFDLLDDRTAGELLGQARQELLVDAGREPNAPLGRAISVLVEYMDERGFAGLIQAAVQERRAITGAIDAFGGVGLLVPAVWRGLGLEPDTEDAVILAEACRPSAFDEAGLRAACAVLAQATQTDQRRAAAITAWLDSQDKLAGWERYLDAFLTQKDQPNGSYVRTRAHKTVRHILEPESDRLVEVCEQLRSAATARATSAMLVAADALFARYQAAKDARALVDYDDLIDITRRLVESNVSWVLYKLDGGIDHLLLDEAQDTNPEQWAIVQALAAEFFAGAGAQDVRRTIFVVGDGKQSIYSFQGADPTALARMRQHFEAQHAGIDRTLQPVDLTTSFRSTAPVLGVVDKVFGHALAADGVYDFSLGPLKHDVDRISAPGLVELWPVLALEEDADEELPWTPPSLPKRVYDPEEELAQRIADKIQDLIAAPNAGEAPITPGDIMILVRRRTRFVGPMVRALKARNVPVAGIDRLELTAELAVQDLVALGRFLLLPEDDLNLAALLKSPLIGVDENALFALAYKRPGTLWGALLASAEEEPLLYRPAQAWLSARLAEVDFKRPYELFAHVLSRPCPGDSERGGSGRRALWRRLGPDSLDPIDELLSAALDYERRHAPTLQGFIGWLDASEAEIKRELAGRSDNVRIVTVHGAKGLEAPIVFLPDTTQLPTPNNGPQFLWRPMHGRRIPYWSPRADMRPGVCSDLAREAQAAVMREYRRLLYVALTRAKDRLYIAGWHGAKRPADGHWHQLIEAGMRAAGAEEAEDGVLRLVRHGASGALPEARDAALAPALPEWVRRPAPPEPRPFRPLAPSRPDFPGAQEPPVRSPSGPEEAARFRRGRAMHRLLQLLPEIDAAERARIVPRLLPEFSAEEREHMLLETERVLNDPGCIRLFGPGSRPEVPIVGRIGTRGITGRIDRLLVEERRVTIVDFKTGRIPREGAHAVPQAYLAQMAAYRAVLRAIYPGREIGVVLVWTDGPVAVMLDPAALDPFETYLTSAPVNARAGGGA